MKPYLLFMTPMSTAPLQGQNPPGSATPQFFDDLTDAQFVAEKEKNNWHRVLLFKRKKGGELEMIEQYREGRKYYPDGQAWR